jgi:hypothetical protein
MSFDRAACHAFEHSTWSSGGKWRRMVQDWDGAERVRKDPCLERSSAAPLKFFEWSKFWQVRPRRLLLLLLLLQAPQSSTQQQQWEP